MRQVPHHPSACCLLSVLPISVLQATAEVDVELLHRTPTERAESAGLLMSNKVQNRMGREKPRVNFKANTGICSRFPGCFLSCASVHGYASQSPELSSELSSPAAFQFFLLFFIEFGPESESLWESCFRFLRR